MGNSNRPSPSLSQTAEVPVADGEVSQVGRAQYLGESELNVQDIVGREERSLGTTRTAILELAESTGTITPKDVAELLDTSQASARTYLGRLKKSRDLISDKPGQFSITATGSVAMSRVALSRDTATAQQGNITPLFHENDNNNDADTEIIKWDAGPKQNLTKSHAELIAQTEISR